MTPFMLPRAGQMRAAMRGKWRLALAVGVLSPLGYILVLMALRMDSIRMLIADDVGVGKTIEALLIAREMMDRGEVRRIAARGFPRCR